jgi:uncharacterized DUF497 family protein
MPDLAFNWDPNKAASNLRKHQVSFGEAQTVFLDERALVIPDPDHSAEEERFVILGMSRAARVLVVVHCFRQDGAVIRIISARRAGTKEQQPFWEKIK